MSRHVVARAEELPPGARKIVRVGGRTVGVFNVKGSYYAVKNSCPHAQAPVCLGNVSGAYLPGRPGEFRWGCDGEVLRCPWHGWEFMIPTGEAIFDQSVRLVTYPVALEDDRIIVDLSRP